MRPDSLKARQIEAAAIAMWARDWLIAAEGEERAWRDEPKAVKNSYRDLAMRALRAAAIVRERERVSP